MIIEVSHKESSLSAQEVSSCLEFGTPSDILVFLEKDLHEHYAEEFWVGRAMWLLQALVPPLCSLRDSGELLLDVDVLKEHMNLDRVIAMSMYRSVPKEQRNEIKRYLSTLPGFGSNKTVALELHGYLRMMIENRLKKLAFGLKR